MSVRRQLHKRLERVKAKNLVGPGWRVTSFLRVPEDGGDNFPRSSLPRRKTKLKGYARVVPDTIHVPNTFDFSLLQPRMKLRWHFF